jgi:hypothetical protein
MQSTKRRISYPQGTLNLSYLNIDDLLDNPNLSFLIDKSVKREFYYADYVNESQVANARKSLSVKSGIIKPEIVPINEMTAKEIRAGADVARLQRSRDKRIVCRFETVTNAKGWIRFDVTSQFTPGKHYKVHIKLKEADDIKYFKEFKKNEIIRLFLTGDLQINCTCPDFRYRFRYMAHQLGYSLFKEMRFPHIRNPRLEGTVCKHCLAVLQILQFNSQAISSKMVKSKFFKQKYEDEEYMNDLDKQMSKKKLTNRGRRK